MGIRQFPAVNIGATGVTVTTTISTSANGTIPNTSAATKARYVRIAATGTCYVRLTVSAGTAVTTDAMVLPGSPLILETIGYTHYAVIDDGASVKVNIAPLEDN